MNAAFKSFFRTFCVKVWKLLEASFELFRMALVINTTFTIVPALTAAVKWIGSFVQRQSCHLFKFNETCETYKSEVNLLMQPAVSMAMILPQREANCIRGADKP